MGQVDDEKRFDDDHGARLTRHASHLALAYRHLASAGLRARYDAEDAVQEVFVRALRDPAGWPVRGADDGGDAALRRYLHALLRHVVIDLARRVRAARRDGRPLPLARSSVAHGPRASGLPSLGPGPATQLSAAEDEERLLAAFDALSAEHRRVIGLRRLEGLSAAEAAERMRRSESAIHSLYRRALLAWEAGVANA